MQSASCNPPYSIKRRAERRFIMADVYVEVGIVKGVANNYLASAQAAMKAAITDAMKKVGSGMTTVKPSGGKGIQVNVLVTKLVQDGINVNCLLISELF